MWGCRGASTPVQRCRLKPRVIYCMAAAALQLSVQFLERRLKFSDSASHRVSPACGLPQDVIDLLLEEWEESGFS